MDCAHLKQPVIKPTFTVGMMKMDFYQSWPKFGIIKNDYLATEDNRFAARQAGGTFFGIISRLTLVSLSVLLSFLFFQTLLSVSVFRLSFAAEKSGETCIFRYSNDKQWNLGSCCLLICVRERVWNGRLQTC